MIIYLYMEKRKVINIFGRIYLQYINNLTVSELYNLILIKNLKRRGI